MTTKYCQSVLSTFFPFKIFIYLFLFVSLHWVLVVSCGIEPGMEPRSPALGAQSLSHWTTREVPVLTALCACKPTLDSLEGSEALSDQKGTTRDPVWWWWVVQDWDGAEVLERVARGGGVRAECGWWGSFGVQAGFEHLTQLLGLWYYPPGTEVGQSGPRL